MFSASKIRLMQTTLTSRTYGTSAFALLFSEKARLMIPNYLNLFSQC